MRAISPEQTAYLDLVLERNEHINLTAIKNRDEAIEKHILDSLTICELPEYQKAATVIDIGTGAGIPGAFLAIESPEKDFTLLDSTLKRLKVVDEFTNTLGIDNITTVHARAEEIFRKPEYAEQFDLCVSRAVANLDTLAGWCLPFVRKGGAFVSYKGENYQEEIKAAKKTIKKLGGRVDRIEIPSDVPDSISGHVLIVIRK